MRVHGFSLKKAIKKNFIGYIFIAPVLLGIFLFTLAPMLSSLYYSFFDFNMLSSPKNFGLQNYIQAFTSRRIAFYQSLKVTFTATLIGVPISLVGSFSLALFLNRQIKGIRFLRTCYYLPAIIPVVVSSLIWRVSLDYNYGLFNAILNLIGLPSATLFTKASSTMPTYIFLGFFGFGGGMILWIAQLKSIPEFYYEAAELDGAGYFRKLFKITIPMCTPVIFYNLIMGIIGNLQTFSSVYVLTNGTSGIQDSLLFYVMNIYNNAFTYLRMGYASALAWILFVIIGLLTFIVFKTSGLVFYGEDA